MNNESNELSERERQILNLVASGASNKEIALKLFISTNTVKVHLRNIFTKIDAKSRTEAAMYAVNAGLYSASRPGSSEPAPEASASPESSAVPPIQRSIDSKWPFWILALTIVIGLIAVVVMRNLDDQKVYTVAGEVTRWKKLPPMPTGRSGFASAVYQKSIITVGGASQKGITGVVEIYDLETGEWSIGLNKPTPITDAGAVVLAGKIYVPGGLAEANRVVNVLEIYNPMRDTWEIGAPLPKSLCGYGITAFEGLIYLFGGWDGENYSADVYSYNPVDNSWHKKMPMPSARAYLGAGQVGRSIHLLGGFDGNKALNLNEIYQPDLENNNLNPWSQGGKLPDPRYRMGVISTTDMILLIGGTDEADGSKKPIQYSPQLDEWVIFDNPEPGGWSDMSLAVYGSNLYAIGGVWDHDFSDQFFSYQIYYTISFPVLPVQEP